MLLYVTGCILIPMKKIGVIGLWHLGCVLCAAWSRLGHTVIGFDSDLERVAKLKKGEPPLFEPDLAETIGKSLGEGKVSFSDQISDLHDCDFIFLSFDTPVLEDDSSDTSILVQSIQKVQSVMKDGAVLVVSSQSPVGFCRQMRNILKKHNPSLELAYSPENLRLGEAIKCYLEPGRIILGTSSTEADAKCRALFSEITDQILGMSLESSEMVKHGINSFLSTSIVFANHLSDLCEVTGARIDDVVSGMKSDVRIGQGAYLAPGIGFSGGTLGRDLRVLSGVNRIADGDAGIFARVYEYNAGRKNTIVRRIERLISGLDGRKILILGATYKPGTSTLRRSLPLEIARLLIENGSVVNIYDPKADFAEIEEEINFGVASGIEEGADGADMLVLLTNWPEFAEFDWARASEVMAKPIFFDGRNFLKEQVMRDAGFEYYSIGRT